jgi:hypothetical protein
MDMLAGEKLAEIMLLSISSTRGEAEILLLSISSTRGEAEFMLLNITTI